jgi:hypothetical protein
MSATPTKPSPPALVTRALSINEPWAYCIVAGPAKGEGWKPVENRSWSTDFRGTVAVHASTSKRHLNIDTALYLVDAHPKLEEQLENNDVSPANPLFHFGAIIGTVDIVGCVAFNPDSGEDDFDKVCRAAGHGEFIDRIRAVPANYWAEGAYCWLLDNPKQFTQPIPAKGKLNVYRLDPGEIAAVAKAMKSPLGSPVDYRKMLAAAGKELPALPPVNEKTAARGAKNAV